MRHSATRALLERDDVIIVASVSCLYGIGSVETYSAMTFAMQKGETADQREIIRKLVALQYKRNDAAFARGTFRVRGDNRWEERSGGKGCGRTWKSRGSP